MAHPCFGRGLRQIPKVNRGSHPGTYVADVAGMNAIDLSSSLISRLPKSGAIGRALVALAALAAGCSGGDSEEATAQALSTEQIGHEDMLVPMKAVIRFELEPSPLHPWPMVHRCGKAMNRRAWIQGGTAAKAWLEANALKPLVYQADEVSAQLVGGACVATVPLEAWLDEEARVPPVRTQEIIPSAEERAPGGSYHDPELAANIASIQLELRDPIKARRRYPEYKKYVDDGVFQAVIPLCDVPSLCQYVDWEPISSSLRNAGFMQAPAPYARTGREEDARAFTKTIVSEGRKIEARVVIVAEHGVVPYVMAAYGADYIHAGVPSMSTFGDEAMAIRFGTPHDHITYALNKSGLSAPPTQPKHRVWASPPESSDRGADDDILGSASPWISIQIVRDLVAELEKPPTARRSWNDIIRAEGQRIVTGMHMADNEWQPSSP